MGPFNYILSVTGDCQSTGSGAISILPIDGTPPYTIQWVDPPLPPDEILTNTASTRTNLVSGFYNVRLIDSTLPVNYDFYVNIYVSSGTSVFVTGIQDTTCGKDNGSVSATCASNVSSNYYGIYTSGGTLLNSFVTDVAPAVFNNLSAGTYYIESVDVGGCSATTATFVIQDSSPVDFGFYVVADSRCSNNLFPIGKLYITGLTGTPPFTYEWSTTGNTSSVTGLTSGQYSCTVTDSLNCKTTKNVFVPEVDPLGLSYFTASTPSCFAADGSITMFITGGTGPYYYSASTGDVSISYAQNFTINGVGSGVYQFLVTDAGLCQIFEGTTISTPQSIGSVTVNTINSTCSNSEGQIQISVFQGQAPFNYTLVYPDSSSQTVTLESPNFVFQNLETGTYTILVSDQSSCVYSQDVTIFTSNEFTITTSVTGTTCSQSNGTISIIKSTGGTEPFNYFLDGIPQFLETNFSAVTFSNVSSGSHVVTVTDALGCSQSETVSINSSAELLFSLFTQNCNEGYDGSITAFISSGTPPYNFIWSDNVLGNPQNISVSNLSAGTYSLTIIDSNGCSSEQQTEIICETLISGDYAFPVSENELTVNTQNYSGMLQLLNDGFYDLTDGDPNCELVSAEFRVNVDVEPAGLSASTIFYVGKTLTDLPPDNLFTDTVVSLLYSLPGILNVIVDINDNSIIIQKNPSNAYLDYQIINVYLSIEYNINC